MPSTRHEIERGMMQWEPGTLSTFTIKRILRDALADLWRDCWRQGVPLIQQVNMFREILMEAIRDATNQDMKVI